MDAPRESLNGDDMEPKINKFFSGQALEQSYEHFLTLLLLVDSNVQDNSPPQLMNVLKSLAGPRQVCQYQFKANDIVWICKQCQKDETCVLCHECYQNSCHDGHEVYFYHSAAGGCCDCGDRDAWDSKGFCSKHGNYMTDPLSFIPDELIIRAREMFQRIFVEIATFFTRFAARFDDLWTVHYLEKDSSYSLFVYFSEYHTLDEINDILNSQDVVNLLNGARPRMQLEHANTGYLLLYTVTESRAGSEDVSVQMMDMADKVLYLKRKGLHVAALSQTELKRRDAVIGALDWLQKIALINDGLCKLICQSLDVPALTKMMEVDLKLDKQISKRFHNLVLTLMADHSLKMKVAIAYAKSFTVLSNLYGKGFGIGGNCAFNLSVQFLNREQYVNEMSFIYNFLGVITNSLIALFINNDTGALLDFKHKVIERRRYNPNFSDLKIIFIIPEIGRFFMSTCLEKWLELLTKLQYMHSQVRAILSHLDFEDRTWLNAFNLYLTFSTIFDHIVIWFANEDSVDSKEVRYVSCTPSAKEQLSDSTKIVSSPRPSFLSAVRFINNGISILSKMNSTVVSTQSKPSEDDIPSVAEYVMISAFDSIQMILAAVKQWQRRYLMANETKDLATSLSEELHYPKFLKAFSFHLPLHRFLSTTISEALKYPHHIGTVSRILESLDGSLNYSNNIILFPLQTIIFSAQIKLGMWRRNGSVMHDQLMNYSDSPFCRVFKDQDRFLLQFVLLKYPFSDLIFQLFQQFNLSKCLRRKKLKRKTWPVPDVEYLPGLMDEALRLIINIATELPPPPHVNVFMRLRKKLQRTLIHKLIGGSATYSQIQDSFAVYQEYQKLDSKLLDEVIFEVSDRQSGNVLKPPSFSLKKQYWKHYDPAFPHLTDTVHQAAFEFRPKSISNEPMVLPPPETHPLLKLLPYNILLEEELLNLIRDLFHIAAAERCKIDAYKDFLIESTIRVTESVFLRIIHIMTLVMHLVSPDISTSSIAPLSKESLSRHQSSLSMFLLETSNDLNSSLRSQFPSLLCTLMDLKAASSEAGSTSGNNSFWLGWIVDRCENLSPQCQSYIREKLHPKNIGEVALNRGDEKEERMQRVRKQAMDSVKASAASFMSAFEGISDDDSDEEDEIVKNAENVQRIGITDVVNENAADPFEVASSPSVSHKKSEQRNHADIPTCIICHSNAANSDGFDLFNPIAYLAFCQASTVLKPTAPSSNIFLAANYDSTGNAGEVRRWKMNEGNMHFIFCGHAVHYSCHEDYYSKVLPKSSLFKSNYIDTESREFPCPLCKKLNNILIPFVYGATRTGNPKEGKLSGTESSSKIYDWIRTPSFTQLPCEIKTSGTKRARKEGDSSADIAQIFSSVEFEVLMNIDTIYYELRQISKDWFNRFSPTVFDEAAVFLHILFNRFVRDFSRTVFILPFSGPPHAIRINKLGGGGIVSLSRNTLEAVATDAPVEVKLMKVTSLYSTGNRGGLREENEHDVEDQSSAVMGQVFRDLQPHLEVLISAIAYTICCDTELQKNTADATSAGSSSGFTTESLYIHKVVDVLTWTLICNDCQHSINKTLSLLIRGSTTANVGWTEGKVPSEIEEREIGEEAGQRGHWLSVFSKSTPPSILSLPLLDFLILAVAVTQVGGRDIRSTAVEACLDDGDFSFIDQACPWICLARLVQLMIEHLPSLLESEKRAAASSGLSLFASISSVSSRMSPLLDHILELLKSSPLAVEIESTATNRESMLEDVVHSLLQQWSSYLRAVKNLFSRIPICVKLVSDSSKQEKGVSEAQEFQDLCGLSEIFDDFRMDMSGVRRVVLSVISGWSNDFLATKRAQNGSMKGSPAASISTDNNREESKKENLDVQSLCYATYPYPFPKGPNLIDLPREYTKLYAAVSSLNDYKYDHPALCLVCGALLNAGGKQQCYQHTLHCNRDAGLFFLVQDSTVLLCHGRRCAYFPTPYVDIHGESHQSYRGKPLHLDPQIYGLLKSMWLAHKIPREVYSRRTASTRMIILGYY